MKASGSDLEKGSTPSGTDASFSHPEIFGHVMKVLVELTVNGISGFEMVADILRRYVCVVIKVQVEGGSPPVSRSVGASPCRIARHHT